MLLIVLPLQPADGLCITEKQTCTHRKENRRMQLGVDLEQQTDKSIALTQGRWPTGADQERAPQCEITSIKPKP